MAYRLVGPKREASEGGTPWGTVGKMPALQKRKLGTRNLGLLSFLQFLCYRIYQCRLILQGVRCPHDLLLGLFPFFLFDGLANTRNRLDTVSGISTGSVDQVLKPRTAGQSFGRSKLALVLQQLRVDRLPRGRAHLQFAVFRDLLQRLLIALRTTGERIPRILQRREVQVRRNFLNWRRD